jgi:hypothetical protein
VIPLESRETLDQPKIFGFDLSEETAGSIERAFKAGAVERASFYRLEGEVYNEYRPTCATESALLDEVVINYCRMQRVRELESRTLNDESPNPKLFALYFPILAEKA